VLASIAVMAWDVRYADFGVRCAKTTVATNVKIGAVTAVGMNAAGIAALAIIAVTARGVGRAKSGAVTATVRGAGRVVFIKIAGTATVTVVGNATTVALTAALGVFGVILAVTALIAGGVAVAGTAEVGAIGVEVPVACIAGLATSAYCV